MVQNYVFEAQGLIEKRSKEIIFHLSSQNKSERSQLLDVLQKHGNYIDFPDNFSLRTKIADHLIAENDYCF